MEKWSEFQIYHIIWSQISTFQQENYGLNTGKKLSIKTVPDGSQILDLLGKDFKSAIMNVLKELKESMTVMLQIRNTNKETEI